MIKELIRGVSLMEVRFPEMKEIIEDIKDLIYRNANITTEEILFSLGFKVNQKVIFV